MQLDIGHPNNEQRRFPLPPTQALRPYFHKRGILLIGFVNKISVKILVALKHSLVRTDHGDIANNI